ncbi:hypothetical protein [Nocardia carnea]|uniref:hypothetical protein n=1 Tax=Nocardia carnea TaxID=37328 RepID=UPI00245532ED|nr:hypothetical protein [Nocardia carnea]
MSPIAAGGLRPAYLAAGLSVRGIDQVLACAGGGGEDVEPCMEPTLRAELTSLDGELDDRRHRRNELRDFIERVAPPNLAP